MHRRFALLLPDDSDRAALAGIGRRDTIDFEDLGANLPIADPERIPLFYNGYKRRRREPADRLRELGRDVQQRVRIRRQLLLAGLGLLADHRPDHARLRQPVQRARGLGRGRQRDLRRGVHGRSGRRAGSDLADHVRVGGLARERADHEYTYAALSMRDGDGFAKQFGGASGDDPDYFLLTITGRDALDAITAASSSRSPTTASRTTRSTTSSRSGRSST
jgi:hypothetical protein